MGFGFFLDRFWSANLFIADMNSSYIPVVFSANKSADISALREIQFEKGKANNEIIAVIKIIKGNPAISEIDFKLKKLIK